MKIEIVDNKTFMVGETVYEVGDELKLTDAEQAVLNEIVALEQKLSDLKQKLVDVCHLAERNFIPSVGDAAHELSRAGIEFSYKLSVFVNDLHRRIGGLLPIVFNEDKTKVLVRERKQDGQGLEDVNYTVASVKRSIKMNMMEDQRLLAIAMAGDKKAVKIDMKKNLKFHFQPIEFSKTTAVDVLESMKAGVIDLLEKRLYLSEMLVLFKKAGSLQGGSPVEKTCFEGAAVNMAVQSPDPGAQRERWEGIVSYAKELGPDSLAFVSRKAPGQPKKGAPQEPETVVLSVLHRDCRAETIYFTADSGAQRKFTASEKTVGTFEAPGGSERFVPLFS